jgi:hypothetical protein
VASSASSTALSSPAEKSTAVALGVSSMVIVNVPGT